MSVDWRAMASANKVTTIEQARKLFSKTPVKALEHLRALWNASRENLKTGHVEITLMVNALQSHIYECQNSPTSEAEFWKDAVATELPLVLLDIISVSCFYNNFHGWLELIIHLNCLILSAWENHGLSSSKISDGRLSERLQNTVPSDSLIARYFHGLGLVWNTLWDERDRLLDDASAILSESGAQAMSTSLSVFAYILVKLHGSLFPIDPDRLAPGTQISGPRHFEATRLTLPMVKVILACWTTDAARPKPSCKQSHFLHIVTHYAHAVEVMLAADPNSKTLWRSTVDEALDGIGHHKFMSTYCTAFSSGPHMVGINLEYALKALGLIVGFHQELQGPLGPEDIKLPTRRACWGQPMIKAIASALKRENRVGAVPPFEGYVVGAYSSMVTYSCDMLACTFQSLKLSEQPPVVDGASIYGIFSRSLRMLCSALKSNDHMEWANAPDAIRALEGTCDTWTAPIRDGWPNQSPLQAVVQRRIRKDLVAAAEASWCGDMRALRAQQSSFHGNKDFDTILLTWSRFGDAWGLEEMTESEWRAAQHKHLCGWVGCEFHVQRSPTPLSTCKGCRERNYCSRECQIKDWKKGGHREKCRRLSAF